MGALLMSWVLDDMLLSGRMKALVVLYALTEAADGGACKNYVQTQAPILEIWA